MFRSEVICAIMLGMAFVVRANPPWMVKMYNQENEYRAHHSANPFTLNPKLSNLAQTWADKLASDCGDIEHSPETIQFQGSVPGENVYSASTSEVRGVTRWALEEAPNAAKSWYSEIKDYPWPVYNGQSLPKGVDIEHFTQQVWKDTTDVGYGVASKEGCDKIYVVANYWPAGNVEGDYGANVLPRTTEYKDEEGEGKEEGETEKEEEVTKEIEEIEKVITEEMEEEN